ncbi:hypothetical protein ABVK25_010901 [Lepraria finkii]|uniref:Uncharacterized protein n=1 Tax=Lepraria finkii TaxID=1340010 RepID=A0ABR4AUM5_9LECA
MHHLTSLYFAIALQLSSCLAASLPALSVSNPSLHSSINENLTLPLNFTLTTSSNELPSDPWTMGVPRSVPGQTLKFSKYGHSLDQSVTIRTLLKATNDVIDHQNIPGGGDTRMGTRDVQYSVGNVILIVWPGSQMTWAMWGNTVRGVTDFLTRWSFVEVNFEVYVIGYQGTMAEGRLMIA